MRSAVQKLARRIASLDAFAATRQLVAQERPVILDVGAHIGESALRYRSLFPDATIHCFEPFPPSFDILSVTTRGDPLVECYQVALSDSIGTAKLSVNRSKATNSLLESDQRASHYWGESLLDTETVIEVATQTIDAFCSERGIHRINVLKLDVQGAEYAVLSGAADMLARQSIDLVYMEMITAPTYLGQRKLHEYLAFFDSYNYEIFDFYNSVRRNGRLIQSDNLMISSAALQRYEG